MKRIYDLTKSAGTVNTWICSDHHLGDERMKILGRPFSSSEDMIEKFIELHNLVVKPNDEVIMVGDICNKDTPEMIKHVSRFNGNKTLIRGNHDINLSDEELSEYFDEVIPDGEGMEIEVEGMRCYITHYPTQGKEDRFNLVGHSHSAWRYQLNMFNIGIDANHFLPVNLKTIPNHYKAICEFYDDDVWVAYNEINAKYAGKRGKKGRYFK